MGPDIEVRVRERYCCTQEKVTSVKPSLVSLFSPVLTVSPCSSELGKVYGVETTRTYYYTDEMGRGYVELRPVSLFVPDTKHHSKRSSLHNLSRLTISSVSVSLRPPGRENLSKILTRIW